MQRKDERDFRNLKVVILNSYFSSDTHKIASWFIRNGFSVFYSNDWTVKAYGDVSILQECLANCPCSVNLIKVRNKRFYENIY